MRSRFASCAVAIFLAGALPAGHVAAAEVVRVSGTGTAMGMLHQVSAEFTAATGFKISVIPSLGSSGAIRALANRVIDVAVSARPLTAAESAGGLLQIAVFRTAFVIATSHRKPNGLNVADLPKIYMAEKPAWADGTPIRLILRPKSESDTALLGAMAAGMPAAIDAVRRRPEVPTAATDQDNVELAERLPGSLTTTTVTQLQTERRHLQIVPLNGVEPTLANFESRAYPYAKTLYVIVRIDSDIATSQLIEFLRSPRGLKALREAAVLPEAT